MRCIRTRSAAPLVVVACLALVEAVAGQPYRPVGQDPRPTISPGRAALLSGVLPGAGQYALGQRRSWAYLAAEAIGWAFYIDRRTSAVDFRRRYRDFAWSQARLQTGLRMDGDFEYYERMSKWSTSGRFDADPGTTGVQPEPDPATFNGATWVLARRIFLPDGSSVPESDPRYQSALEYYRSRAYGPEFLWDWSGDESAQEEFGSLIRRSDDRFRQATGTLGLVFANHLVSMVDAFVSARVPSATMRSGFVPSPETRGLRWTTRVELRIVR